MGNSNREKLEELRQQIDSLGVKLQEYNESLEAINLRSSESLIAKQAIDTLSAQANSALLLIKKAQEEIEQTQLGIQSIGDEAGEHFQSLKNRGEELDKFFVKVFGKKGQDGNREGGLERELDLKRKNFELFQHEQEEKHQKLFDKIEALLTGATSVGLASAYADQKKSFATPNKIWSALFILSMVGIIIVTSWSFNKDLHDYKEALTNLLTRLPFIFAFSWLALFASKQQSQNKRLEQEYAHKEALAKSFEGYKKQIEGLGKGDEAKSVIKKLYDNVVEMTSFNPSETLDKKHDGVRPPFIDRVTGVLPEKE